MATQGMISVVKGGKVVVKIVVGCNGMYIANLTNFIEKLKCINLEKIKKEAEKVFFECSNCLVIMNKDLIISEDDTGDPYRDTFKNPNFNPRWGIGTTDYLKNY